MKVEEAAGMRAGPYKHQPSEQEITIYSWLGIPNTEPRILSEVCRGDSPNPGKLYTLR